MSKHGKKSPSSCVTQFDMSLKNVLGLAMSIPISA